MKGTIKKGSTGASYTEIINQMKQEKPFSNPEEFGLQTNITINSKTSNNGNITLTAADVGARPDTWTPTATDVGARPNTWMPSAEDVGARPNTWNPTLAIDNATEGRAVVIGQNGALIQSSYNASDFFRGTMTLSGTTLTITPK